MKKIIYLFSLVALLWACTPAEVVVHPSEANVPSAAGLVPQITVDQTTNEVTFSLKAENAAGLIPIWNFQDKDGEWTVWQAQQGYKKVFPAQGDYNVRMYVQNASGMSPDHVQATFTIENTLVDFTKYFTLFSKGTWHIDNTVKGHMGCGESVENPTGWWSADPDDKAQFGVYDNTLTFTADGQYTFNPGAAGTVYVNIGVTKSPYVDAKGDNTEDYVAPASEQTTEYKFEVSGEDIYVVFVQGAYFPYIPNDSFIDNPRLLVKELTAKAMTLISVSDDICWQFILTNGAGGGTTPSDDPGTVTGPQEYDYNNEANLWKPIDEAGPAIAFYYAPGWAQIDDPVVTKDGSKYSWTFSQETFQQWQAQSFFTPGEGHTGPELSASKKYDFSCVLQSSTDIAKVTVKLHKWKAGGAADQAENDELNGIFLFTENVSLTAFEDKIVDLSACEGIDADYCRLVIDFGGNPAGSEVSVKNITLKDHDIDDGTHKGGGSVPPTVDVTYDSAANLWKPVDDASDTEIGYYYADANWTPFGINPTLDKKGGKYTWTLPNATAAQWQAQVFILPKSGLNLSSEKFYDVKFTLCSSLDMAKCTVKLHKWERPEPEANSDRANELNGIFLFNEEHALPAYEEVTVSLSAVKGIDADLTRLVVDFGGNQAGTEVYLENMTICEHTGEVPSEDPSEEPSVEPGDADPLYGTSSKSWVMDSSVKGHLACGDSEGNPAGWWSANANEKDGCGLYDNIITFHSDGKYEFDPGQDGLIYVHWSCKTVDGNTHEEGAGDWTYAWNKQQGTYTFEGGKITLSEHMTLGYICFDSIYANPVFTVKELTASKLVLVAYTATENKGGPIAWQYIFKPAQ